MQERRAFNSNQYEVRRFKENCVVLFLLRFSGFQFDLVACCYCWKPLLFRPANSIYRLGHLISRPDNFIGSFVIVWRQFLLLGLACLNVVLLIAVSWFSISGCQ